MQNINLIIFCFVLLLILSVYILKALAIQPSKHLPVWSDEFGYYANSYGFYLNTTTQSSLTFSGKGAVLGGGAAHGFMYFAFHGSIAKLFGWSNLSMIITNYILVLSSILVIWFQKIEKLNRLNKLYVAILLLGFAFIPIYLQTYMQEILHLFLAICCSLFVLKIYKKDTINKTKIIVSFIVFLILISFFRPLWFFWIIVLVPLARNKKELIVWILVSITGFSLSFIYSKLFFEFTPGFFSDFFAVLKTETLSTSVSIFAHHAMDNIYMYFRLHENPTYNFIKFSYIFILIYFFIRIFTLKNRIDIACFLVVALNIILLIVCYEASLWREVRVLSPVYYFACIFIAFQTTHFQKYILLFFLLPSFFYASFYNPNDNLQNEHTVKEIKELRLILEDSISKLDINENNNIILVNYRPSDRAYETLSFPLQTKNNIPIKYITPYYEVEKGNYYFVLDKNKKGEFFFRKK